MANIEFGIRITAKDDGYTATVNTATAQTEKLSQAARGASTASRESAAASAQLSSEASILGRTLGGVAAAALAAGSAIYGYSVKAAAEAEQTSARLDAVLRATGESAGVTRQRIDALADSLSRVSKFDDTELKEGAAVLLKFGAVGTDSFDRVMRAGVDLAAFNNTDLRSSLQQLGMAMERPENAMRSLRAAGIALTQAQQDQIKTMVELGDVQGAGEIILTAYERATKGAAEALNSGLTKATDDAKKATNDLLITLGQTSLIGGTYKATMEGIAGALQVVKRVIQEGDWLTTWSRVNQLMREVRDGKTSGPSPQISPGQADAEAAAGNVSRAAAAAEQLALRAQHATKEWDRLTSSLATSSEKFAAQSAAIITAGIAAGKTTEQISKEVAALDKKIFGHTKAAAAIREHVSEADRFIASLKLQEERLGLTEIQQKMVEAATVALTAATAGERMAVMTAAQAWALRKQATDEAEAAQKALTAALDAYVNSATAQLALDQEISELMARRDTEQGNAIRSTRQVIEQIEFETTLIGLSNDQREIAIALRGIETSGIDQQSTAYQTLREQMTAALAIKSERTGVAEAARAYAEEWRRTIDSVSSGLSGLLVNMVEDIGSAGKNAWANFKHWALQAFADIASKQIVVSLIGTATGPGGLGSPGNIGGLGGLGNSLSTLGMFGGDLAQLLGQGIGVGQAVSTALAGAGGFGAVFAAAVPWAALAAIAVPMIMKFFDEGDAQRSGTFASGARASGGNPLFGGSSAFGAFGVVNDKWFSDSDMGKEFTAFITGIKGIDNALSALVGKDMTGQIAAALAAVTTDFAAGMEHESVTFGSILKERYTVVLNTLDPLLGAMLDGFSGTADEMATFVTGLVGVRNGLAALNLNGLDIAALQAFATAAETLPDTFNRIAGAYVSFVDAFTTDAEKLANAQTLVTQTFNTLGIAVPASVTSYRELVQGLDLSTEAGRGMFQTLLAVAPAFLTVQNAVVELTETLAVAAVRLGRHLQELTHAAAPVFGRGRRGGIDAALDQASIGRRSGIIEVAAAAAVQAAADTAAALQVFTDALAEVSSMANPAADALAANASQWDRLTAQGNALDALSAYYDGTTASTQALAQATRAYYTSLVQMLAVIDQLKTSIAGMFAESVRFYEMDGLDKKGQYAYLQSEVERYRAELNTASDPARINYLAQQINADQRQAYGLLDPAEREQVRELFIVGAQAADALAQARLDKAAADAKTRADQLIADIKAAMNEALAPLVKAGETFDRGASKFDDAVDRFEDAEISVKIPQQPTAEGSY